MTDYVLATNSCGSIKFTKEVLLELFEFDAELFFGEPFGHTGFWVTEKIENDLLLVGDTIYPFDRFNDELRKHPKLLEIAARQGIELMTTVPNSMSIVSVPDDAHVYIARPDYGGEYLCEQHRTWR
jgi:hypothetical protein